MPTKREIQERRREAIRNIVLSEDPDVEDQKDLVKKLKSLGIPATQSSVSRDLKELGAMRVKGRYEFPDWIGGETPFRKARGFVLKMTVAGPHMILLVTQPGAGSFVADVLEASHWEDVVGTVVGYSSVLILTEHKFFQDIVWSQLKHYLGAESEEEEQDASKTET